MDVVEIIQTAVLASTAAAVFWQYLVIRRTMVLHELTTQTDIEIEIVKLAIDNPEFIGILSLPAPKGETEEERVRLSRVYAFTDLLMSSYALRYILGLWSAKDTRESIRALAQKPAAMEWLRELAPKGIPEGARGRRRELFEILLSVLNETEEKNQAKPN
jgi:hypothetical protein